MTIAHSFSFDAGADLLGLEDGHVLMSGSGSQFGDIGRQFDPSIITDAGNSFALVTKTMDGAAVPASGAGTGGGSAATLASIPTLGNYLANLSPTSSLGHHFASGTITVNLSGLSLAGELMYARAAMAAWARVANINFVETAGAAQITFSDDGDAVNYNAYANTAWSGPTFLTSAQVHITQKWYNDNGGALGPTGILNSYGYQTYVHELGHALGLGHAGPYNGSATYGVDNVWTNDSYMYTTMSYFDQIESGSGASFSYITSAMIADIYAIQLLYGAPTGTQNEWFGYNAGAGSQYNLANSNSFCMYSNTGIANLDASLYAGTQTVHFDAGTWSSIKGLTNNLSLSTTTHLSAYLGGSGADNIYFGSIVNGNRTANGNDGADVFYRDGASSSTATITANGGNGADVFDEMTSSSGYTFKHTSQSANGWTITKNGVSYDILSGIETLKFTDRTFSLKSTAQHDLTGDFTSDVVWYNASNGATNYWSMSNGGVSSWNFAGAVNPAWTAVGSYDFNGDNRSDILYRRASDGAIGYLSNNGTAWSWNGAGLVSSAWTIAGIGDIDGNGKGDIIYVNNTLGGALGYLSMNGTVGTWHGMGSVGTDWSVKGVGDFNMDGHDDILYYNSTLGQAGYLDYAQGWHSLGTSISTAWTAAAVGDLNADGTADVLMYNASLGGALGYWAMDRNGAATWTGFSGLGAIGTGWTVKAIGDYNNDGHADIMFYNAALGAAGFVSPQDNGSATWTGLGAVNSNWQLLS